MSVRKGVLVTLALAQALVIAGCRKTIQEPEEVSITAQCGKFTFTVRDKKDATKAKMAFYAANIRFQGLDFSDNRFTGSSRFILNNQFFVLDGLESYMNRVGDPPLTLQVRATSTVVNTSSRSTTPCTGPGAAKDFDDMKAAFSEDWRVNVEEESREYERQRADDRKERSR